MTFQQTNSVSQPVTFVTAADGFTIQQNGSVVYSDPTATQVATRTLQPGQTFTQTETWNGIPSGSSSKTPATGSFVLSNAGIRPA